MTHQTLLDELSQDANPSRRKTLIKEGADENTLGIPLGVLRKKAKEIGINHEVGMGLWDSGIIDAQLLAVMLIDPSQISLDKAYKMLEEAPIETLLDDLIFRLLVNIKDYDQFKAKLENYTNDFEGKVYWALIVNEIAQSKKIDPELALYVLTQCKEGLASAPEKTQWMMNRALSELGFRHGEYTQTCLDLGEELAVFKEMKVAPGCTSAYAPDWINAVLRRKKK